MAVLLALTGCVSRVGPVAAPATTVPPPPSSGSVAGECATGDIEVTGTLDEQPKVTLPTDCAAPTTLLAQDLTDGVGPQAVKGSDLEISYVMVTWSDGRKLDSTWSGDHTLPLPITGLGSSRWNYGWHEGMVGMREGGRRLIVAPPGDTEGEAGDTLVFVVDAVSVTP
jgi:peptidylprolyl isomerase